MRLIALLCAALGAALLFWGLPGADAAPASIPIEGSKQRLPLVADPPVEQLSVKLRVPDISALQTDFGLQVVRTNEWTGVATVGTPPGADPEQLASLLEQHPVVEWAEPVRWRRHLAGPIAPLNPNDANYDAQRWYYELISAPGAWGLETGKSTVTIAVLDSGVMCAHPDLATNIWRNTREIPGNLIDDDGNGFVDDVNGFDFVGAEAGGEGPNLPGDGDPCVKAGDPSVGNARDDDADGVVDAGVSHGTLVAGIIAAMSNNSVGVAGMCWNCMIMSVRVANAEGWIRSSDLADAITYASRNGAKVINVSLGGPQFSQAEVASVNLAVNAGVTVVGASGNENRSPISYPAQLPNVIAVGASDQRDPKGRAPFSNWGTGTASDRPVDVVAPGVQIVSTYVTSAGEEAAPGGGIAGSGRYGRASGTSFSAPLVSGMVGLLLSRNPSLTPAQAKQIVRSTASTLPNDPDDSPDAGTQWAGAGMVNAQLAIENLSSVPTATPTATSSPVATATPTSTPLPAGSRPRTVSPATGTTLTSLSTTLNWANPAGATQYQVRVLPANNDGPAINLIRNLDTSYAVQGPVFGTGPYVMLPGMTYTWRIRTTTATTGVDENSPLWGEWSTDSTFKTRGVSSAGITPVSPPNGATGTGLTPTIQWANSDSDVFYYEIQLSRDPSFDTDPARATAMVYWELRHGAVTNPVNSYAVPAAFPLQARTTYFWRVRPRIQGDGVPVAWSTLFSFTTA